MTKRDHLAAYSILISAFLGVSAVVGYDVTIGQFVSPWMGDASRYIEATRSLLRGEPLLLHQADGIGPMKLWPPGYPVLGGIAATAGLAAPQALLLVTRLSLAACASAVAWASMPILGAWPALFAGMLCLTAPGLVTNADLASTDAVFCLVSIIAAGSLVRGRYFLAGFFVSAGLCLRNAGMALVFAAVFAVVAERASCTTAARRLLRLIAGAAPLSLSLELWNLVALGSLRPYEMPASTRGLSANLQDLATALVFDFAPVYRFAHAIPWIAPVLAVVAISAGAVGLALFTVPLSAPTRRFLLFAGCYVGAGVTMTVLARTRYEWGEPIWERHTSQYDWWLIPALAATTIVALPAARRTVLTALIAVSVVVIGLRCAAMADQWRFYNRTAGEVARIATTGEIRGADPHIQLRQMFRAYEDSGAITAFAQALDRRCKVVSNIGDLILAVQDIPTIPAPAADAEQTPAVFLIAALPPGVGPNARDPAPPEDVPPVPLPGLPAGLRVYAKTPDLCFSHNRS